VAEKRASAPGLPQASPEPGIEIELSFAEWAGFHSLYLHARRRMPLTPRAAAGLEELAGKLRAGKLRAVEERWP